MFKNNLFKIFEKNGFFLGLILTVILLWPLAKAPYFTHHDDIQPVRLYEVSKCLEDGQIPCRWVPDMGDGYGFPIFNYYGPLAYYFGAFFYLLTNNLLVSTKIMFAIPFVGAYIFMYLCARKFWGNIGGVVSGLFYSFAPYHALVMYVRGAMGETWALMFFPAVFWSLTKLYGSPKITNLLLLSLFLSLLITSHNLSTMIFMPFVLGYALFLFFFNRNLRFLKLFTVSLLLGVLLASFYLIPVLVEKDLVHVDSTISGYFSYTEHFKGIKKLFIDRFWGYGGSFREVPGGPKDGLSYQIGWVHVLGWVISILVAIKLWKKDKFVSSLIFFLSIPIIVSIFMIHPRSEFIWKIVEPLKYLQFPWRFLMIIIFFISILAGSFVKTVQEKFKMTVSLLIVVLVIVLNFSYFKPEKFLYYSDSNFLSGDEWNREIGKAVFDFLPVSAKEPPASQALQPYQILTGQTEIIDFRRGTNWMKFQTNTRSHSIIRISQFYFPNWRLTIDGMDSNIDYTNNNLGLITFLIGKGKHTIDLKLLDTPVRTIGNWLTILGISISLILLLTQFKKTRYWIFYYLRSLNR